MSTLLEQLRAARRERKIAQKALGERLGLPQSHVSAIEAGKVDPRLSSVLEFARVLDLEPMLIPRDRVLAVRALLEGKPDAPLWSVDEEEEEAGDDGGGGR
ncbi:MAG: helix-turn-helix transcriptional regulator [Polyangiaceae bacterium]|jgi:predicted transcriptional regulator